MSDLAMERAHLVKAESDIGEGERRVAAQILLIERLRQDGHATGEAERLLVTFEQTLKTWKEHREAILEGIARLEKPGAR